jgi:prophage regulatory protein
MREQLPTTGFLRLHQIIGNPTSPGIIPISKSAWWEGVRTKRFPQPVKLGPRTTA